jgi:hypothetical protein
MKKLFTLVALLACFLGAKADLVEVYKVDYSSYNGFPFYVMGYVPEWYDGVMTDLGGNYTYAAVEGAEQTSDVIVKTQGGVEYYRLPSEGTWHQYFIADQIPTEMDGHYIIKAMVKASEPITINVNMGWGWGNGEQASANASIGTEWEEVEWEYTGIAGSSCNLVAQPNTAAQIEWKSLTVYQDKKESRPVVWQEWLTNDGKPIIPGVETDSKWMGDAETPWEDATVRFNDQTKNYLICAWSKEKGRNMNDDGGWDPFPSDIEEVDGSHVFVCHGQPATTEGDASAWDNQFWIQSPQSWKSGTQVKVHFRYKASAPVSSTDTQIHKQNPSDYLIWHAIGNIAFTTEWQEFDGTMTIADDMATGWSIAFNLNSVVKDAVDFYFDDLSWQTMVLDEGHFVAACNTLTGLEYDFDNAIEFAPDPDDPDLLVATVGEVGKENTWVNQVMISTVRGNDASFKSNTIKPSGTIVDDPDTWLDYTSASLAKLTLPGSGVWKISLAPNFDEEGNENGGQINFIMLEGTASEQKEIKPNPTEVIVHGLERDDVKDDAHPEGTGQPWDNQFFIVANRTLSTGEATVVSFKYKSSIPAHTTTQLHGNPGGYLHWAAIGDVDFTEEWQNFEKALTVPAEANDMKSIAFNMAEIKEACDYYIKDVIWKLDDGTESLIDQTGSNNFYVKEGAGTEPHVYEGGAGINSVVNNKNVSTATYNLSGQRVSKDYKGIVVKNGKKVVLK